MNDQNVSDKEQWTMVVCVMCGIPWEVDGGPSCDHEVDTAELAVVPLARLAEVERERDHAWNCHKGQVETKRRLSKRYGQLCARVEAAETALREAEEAAQDFIESSAPTGYSSLDRRAYNDDRDALREILKRARTTTTEEVTHV